MLSGNYRGFDVVERFFFFSVVREYRYNTSVCILIEGREGAQKAEDSGGDLDSIPKKEWRKLEESRRTMLNGVNIS